MKVVVAPDKLRGSLSAREAADAIARGVLAAIPDARVVRVPVADGGEGTAETLADATGGRMVPVETLDALGRPVKAAYALLGDASTAVVEMAAASGLALLGPEERRPLSASTLGTGELIRAALDAGARKIIVGIGGSATTDGGTGMARALGARFLDCEGEELSPGGGELGRLARIDVSKLDDRLAAVDVWVASDVDNPLVGEQGAARVYGPQKGATPDDVDLLDSALGHYAKIVERDLGVAVEEIPGAGAAGGLGAGLIAFLGAALRPGVDLVLDVVGFDRAVEGADLVFTAEGRLDGQTARGKGPAGVARRAAELGVPVVALAGQVAADAGVLHAGGMTSYFALPAGPVSTEEAFRDAAERLADVAEEVSRLVVAFQKRRARADT